MEYLIIVTLVSWQERDPLASRMSWQSPGFGMESKRTRPCGAPVVAFRLWDVSMRSDDVVVLGDLLHSSDDAEMESDAHQGEGDCRPAKRYYLNR